MIRNLRIRLTLLFTILSSLLLLAALLVTWRFSASQYTENKAAAYNTCFHFIADHIASGAVLRDSWLSQQERENGCIIYIEDGNAPLQFSGAWTPDTPRDALIELAKKESLPVGDEVFFTIQGEQKDIYQSVSSSITMKNAADLDHTVHLWILFAHNPVLKHIRLLTTIHFLLWLGGSVVLLLISYLLVRIATRTTEESLRQQNAFIAAASHELRSPLTVMKANLCAIREISWVPDQENEEDRSSRSTASLLTTTENEVTRMQHLTDDLLLLAGSDANILTANLQPVPLDTLLIETYETFLPLARQLQHPFEIILPDQELPSIMADRERIRQLLGIFINNAFAYSGKNTPVELSACQTRGSVVLSVADHGKGIPDEEKKLIFRRFYRSDKSRTDKSHFGLGLSVAQEIAHAHNASVKVSDTPGGGATFSIQFSLRQHEARRHNADPHMDSQ